MSKLLRIVGGLNIAGGVVLAIIFQMLKASPAQIAAAEYAGRQPASGMDSFGANVGSVTMLVGACVASLVFFALAHILDRVEAIHQAVSAPGGATNHARGAE